MKKTIFLVIILLCMTACNKVKPSSSEYNIDDESYDIGYSDGYDEGYEIGYDNGSMDGYKEAYDEIALEDLQADWEYYGYKDALMEIYTFLKAKGYKNILYDEYVYNIKESTQIGITIFSLLNLTLITFLIVGIVYYKKTGKNIFNTKARL